MVKRRGSGPVSGRKERPHSVPRTGPKALVTPGRMRRWVLLWTPGSDQNFLYLVGKRQETAVNILPSDRASWGCPELLMWLAGHTNSKTIPCTPRHGALLSTMMPFTQWAP